MAKIQNVYKDKGTKKWFYKKRLPKGNPTGKDWAIKKGFGTASQARAALDEYLADLKNKVVKKGTDFEQGITLEAFTREKVLPYFEVNLKRKSVECKHNYCAHIFRYFVDMTFDDIRKSDISNFKSYLLTVDNGKGGTLCTNTVNHALCTLSQIYELAIEHELVGVNLVKDIKKLKQKIKRDIKYWTLPEFEKFLSITDKTTYKGYMQYVGFYTLYFSGMRIGEMMARKWSDIDWENESIYIDSTLDYNNVNDWQTKTDLGPKNVSSRAWLKLTPKTIEMLTAWKEKQDSLVKVDYIFMYNGTMYDTRRWTSWKNKLVEQWNKSAPKEQQLKNIRVHDLRDSHGMWLLKQGVDLKTIQKRLRHADAKTTMNYYLGKLPEKEQNVLSGF